MQVHGGRLDDASPPTRSVQGGLYRLSAGSRRRCKAVALDSMRTNVTVLCVAIVCPIGCAYRASSMWFAHLPACSTCSNLAPLPSDAPLCMLPHPSPACPPPGGEHPPQDPDSVQQAACAAACCLLPAAELLLISLRMSWYKYWYMDTPTGDNTTCIRSYNCTRVYPA